jgi:Bacteriochlorophyll C binding protein
VKAMAGLVQRVAADAVEFFEVQSDGWWMWVASMLRTTADAVERITVGTYGVSSGGRVSTPTTTRAETTRFRDKEITSRFTKLG